MTPTWWWKDSCTGTTFDRPDFQDLLDFCRTNPRPSGDPGRFELYDPSRFGRTLTRDGRPDIFGFLAAYNQFEETGWELHFVTVPRTGSDIADVVTMALYAYAAAPTLSVVAAAHGTAAPPPACRRGEHECRVRQPE